ncbi:hypothetical protein [Ferviditalea candida]|uniref:Uncharacterized protein n=1 Tax=Ferviditalea candida TaxID=3108399 RepID=A0ABU5ZP14_9BACL|nr:hypothetical protein [Paenibacillaceae bacterium T2]
MASKRELQALIVLAGKIDPSLQKAMRKAANESKKFNLQSSLIGKTVSKGFDYAKKAALVGTAAIGAALVVTAKKGLDLASDLNEVQNVVDVTFGQNSQQINAWSQTALKSFGLSELSAKQFTSTIGAMMKSSGIAAKNLVPMSENLAALSGDFASFYNLDPAEAFEKIRSGISGETEPLKALGINMSVANLQAFALSKGIKTAYEKMSQADQTVLRYNYLMEQSKDAQGDFARTQGSYANQQRMFGESFKQLAAKIMTKALPAFTKLYEKGNQLIDSFANNPEKMQKLQDIIGKVVDKVIAAIPTAISYAQKFGGAIMYIFKAGYKMFQYIQQNWSTLKPLIYGIVGAMIAWKTVTAGMAIYNQVMNAIKLGTLAVAAAQWVMNAAVLANPMTWVIAGIAAAIGVLVTGIYLLIKHWDLVKAAMIGAWEWFVNLIKKIPDLAFVLAGPLAPILLLIKHFEKLKEIAGGALSAVKKFFGFGGKDKDTPSPSVPKFASGGFANRPSIFGEAGPEAAIPLKRTPRSLSLLNKTAQVLGVGGGGSDRGEGHTFVFAPNYGNGGPTKQQMQEDFEEFKRKCEEWLNSRGRENFA